MKKLFFLLLVVLNFNIYSQPQVLIFLKKALTQTTQDITYDGSYYKIPFPEGDIDPTLGVCTDLVIRCYRAIGIDLQELLYIDILNNKEYYNIKNPDTNIDHRRCKNLMKFLNNKKCQKKISNNGSEYSPGDIVFWDLGVDHVGIVSNIRVPLTNRYYIIHNIGSGPIIEDFLFASTIIGHYRWFPCKIK